MHNAHILWGLADKQWIWLATIVFASSFVLGTYSALILRRKTGRPYILGLVCFGWILQTIGLYARGLEYGGCPLANRFELVQFVVWSAIALYIFVGPAFRVSLLGVFTSGFACLFSILSLGIAEWDSPDRQSIFGDSVLTELHAALAVFSYGVFGILALTSLMFLLQSRSLKSKNVVGGLFPFLPSLVELTQINRRLLVVGFSILTVSLSLGLVTVLERGGYGMTIKLITTSSVWAAFGVTLTLRMRHALTAKRFSWTCIIIFGAALISLEAVNRGLSSKAELRDAPEQIDEHD